MKLPRQFRPGQSRSRTPLRWPRTIADNTAAAQSGDPDALNALIAAADELATAALQNYQAAQTADNARQQAANALSGAAEALGSASGDTGTGELSAAVTQLQQGAAQLQTGLTAYTAGVDQAGRRQCGAGRSVQRPCPPCRRERSIFRMERIPW